MTALAGIWDFRGDRRVDEDAARMLSAQAIYGRDGERRWVERNIALGRRLAKLLPEDHHDAQPLQGAHHSPYVLIADLRLDNRPELIAELRLEPVVAAAMCDAELLLAAFERWDDGCCAHLVGDFAFCLWDKRVQRLVLARDIAGARPLHYHRNEKFFALSSMPKGLHALADIPSAPDQETAAEFLATFPEVGTRSFYHSIERIPPGYVVTVTKTALSARPHWIFSGKQLVLRDRREYVEGLRCNLDRAVQAQLRGAEGRVAAQLSSGFDSSAVVATAARLLSPINGNIVALTAVPRKGYDLPAPLNRLADEGPLAAATAAMYRNIEHVLVASGDRSPLEMLDRYFFLFERPLMNLCNFVWVHAINDEVKARGLTVLLTGTMGNLTISYDGREVLPELLQARRWRQWAGTVSAIVRHGQWRLRGALATSFSPWLPAQPLQWLSRIYGGQANDFFKYSAIRTACFAELGLAARARCHGVATSYRPAKNGLAERLTALRWADMGNYNKGALGGWGIDTRDPTADRNLLEFCLSVPTEHFFRDGVPRSLARDALADRLPHDVLDERRRGLQAAGWHEGLTAARQQMVEEIARLEKTVAAQIVDLPRLRQLVEKWPADGWHKQQVIAEYRLALLRGISVGHFLRRASGRNA